LIVTFSVSFGADFEPLTLLSQKDFLATRHIKLGLMKNFDDYDARFAEIEVGY